MKNITNSICLYDISFGVFQIDFDVFSERDHEEIQKRLYEEILWAIDCLFTLEDVLTQKT